MSYDPNQQPPGYAPYTPPPPSPYGGMQPSGGDGNGLLAVGENREPVTVLLLSLVTCGIYAIWWMYTYTTEIKNALGREDLNPSTDLILTFVTCGLYGIYAYGWKYPQLFPEMQRRTGLPINDISTMVLILNVVGLGIVALFILQTELNKIWDAARAR